MRVLVAMSGGVDSSVAAAILLEEGHEVGGVTLRLWGGESDSGCCSVSDVDDARRVAQQLGIEHWVFNFSDDFDTHVVAPYVADHAAGRTPNPCIECNRHLKFDRLLRRADKLGFDAVATGHHVRLVQRADGTLALARAVDHNKDQSYVLHMLGPAQLARCLFPVGAIDKAEVRRRAAALGLRTAAKPDSQDVCFIARTGGGRRSFLGSRIPLRPAVVVDAEQRVLGRTDAVELVTIGQRRGLGLPGGGPARFAVAVDVASGVVRVGSEDELLTTSQAVRDLSWATTPPPEPLEVLAQCSAHGQARPAWFSPSDGAEGRLEWTSAERIVAPGQSIVLYERDPAHGEVVIGGGTAA